MARPSKLTSGVHDIIVEALASGCYRETAAEHAGIHVATFYRWIEQGEADIEHDRKSAHRELCEAIQEAEAKAELEALQAIKKAGGKSWQAHAWFLERKKPDRWGRRTALEHSGAIDVGAAQGAKIAAAITDVLDDLGVDVADEEVRRKLRERLSAAGSNQ